MLHMLDRIRSFTRDEHGTATTEAIIIFPLLFWSMVTMSVYFDGFRARSTNLKAAYTISDMISRENPFVGPNYINGLNTVYDFLAASHNPTWIRATLVQFDTEDPDNDDDGRYILKWSYGTNSKPKLTYGTLDQVESKIPVIAHGDSLILMETHMEYEAWAHVGIDSFAQDNFIATRPRFPPPKWSDTH